MEARFGELNAGAIVSELRKEIARHEDTVASAHGQLIASRLPGAHDSRRRHRTDEGHPSGFGGQCNRHVSMRRIARLRMPLNVLWSSNRLFRSLDCATLIERERCSGAAWPFLRDEPDVTDDLLAKATTLEDLLARETFYRELPIN